MSEYATPTITRRARKSHQCDWCGKKIHKGDTYRSWTWFDDTATSMHSHKACYKTAMDSRIYINCYGKECVDNEPVWFERDKPFG